MDFVNFTPSNCKHYVYQHIRLDKNEIFYVGVGTHHKKTLLNGYYYSRAKAKHSNKIWQSIINKSNYRAEIIYESNNHNAVLEYEKQLILRYGKIYNQTGSLANFTDGGEGSLGFACTKGEHLQKKCYAYTKDGYFFKAFDSFSQAAAYFGLHNISSFTRLKYSHAPRLIKNYQFRLYKTDKIDAVENVSEWMRKSKSKSVVQLTITGEFIKEWNSAIQAASTLRSHHIVSLQNNITSCCRRIKNSAGGFKWRFKTDENKFDTQNQSRNKKILKIIQTSIQGDFIYEWDNASQAAQQCNTQRSHIHECCKGKVKTAGGYCWSYKKYSK